MTSMAGHSFVNTSVGMPNVGARPSLIPRRVGSDGPIRNFQATRNSDLEDVAPPLPPREVRSISTKTTTSTHMNNSKGYISKEPLNNTQGYISKESFNKQTTNNSRLGFTHKEELDRQNKTRQDYSSQPRSGFRKYNSSPVLEKSSESVNNQQQSDNRNNIPQSNGPVSILKTTSKYGNSSSEKPKYGHTQNPSGKSSLTVNSLLAKASTGLRYTSATRKNSDRTKPTQDLTNNNSRRLSDTPPTIPPRVLLQSNTPSVGSMTKISSEKETFRTNSRGVKTPATPEPKPLTYTNVTEHDKIWTPEDGDQILGTPVKHITPESTAEFFSKIDPLDITESASDSSADTMIMMTTEEEKRNENSIKQSTQIFEAKRTHPFYEELDSKQDYNCDTTVTNHCENSSFYDSRNTNYRNSPVVLDSEKDTSKSNPDGMTSSEHISIITSKTNGIEEDISADDGYGTNSSSGTNLSSPLSSSSSSTTNSDLESSQPQGILKNAVKPANPRPSILKNPLPEQPGNRSNTWAVRRRARTAAESQDNSLQEKLRQLTIIQEEEGNHGNEISANQQAASYDRVPSDNNEQFRETGSHENSSVPTDLQRFEGNLSDKFTDMDRNYRNYYDFDKNSCKTQEDSKVLYFQQKLLKQNYTSDNYYNPHTQHQDLPPGQGQQPPPSPREGQHNVDRLSADNRQMNSGPNVVRSDMGPSYSGQYRRTASDYNYLQNMSYDGPVLGDHDKSMLQKGMFTSLDNVNQNGRRTVFASSADIYNMFQSNNTLATQLQRPASYRHSFHAVPNSNVDYALNPAGPNQASTEDPRPRASSASVVTSSQQSKSSWNPFGGMFKKKSKTQASKLDKHSASQEKKGSNKPTEKSSTLDRPQKLNKSIVDPKSAEPTKPLPPAPKQQYTIVPIIRQPKQQLMRNTFQERPTNAQDILAMKSQTLPLRRKNMDGSSNMYDRFRTVETEEGDSTKLSTLV